MFYRKTLLLKLMKILVSILCIIVSLGALQYSHATSGISITSPVMVDTMGKPINDFHVGQQIGVESTLTNNGNSEQKFAYMVQVLDSNGASEHFESFSASMLSQQSFTASQVWIPKNPGQYTIQVFVWDSLSSGIPLTDVLQKQITINP